MKLQDQLDNLEEKRRGLQAQLDEVEGKMNELKKKRAEELYAELKELGLEAPKRGRVQRQRDPEKPCPICNIKGHDARAHRSQGKNKKPFTKEELKEKGFAA